MAGLAFGASIRMCSRFCGAFADSVMATSIVATQTQHFRIIVVKGGDDPIVDIVAGFALVGGNYVVWALATSWAPWKVAAYARLSRLYGGMIEGRCGGHRKP
jgi:hypothetical protein